jgi:hypothetical protein
MDVPQVVSNAVGEGDEPLCRSSILRYCGGEGCWSMRSSRWSMGDVKWLWVVAVSMFACLQAGSSVNDGASDDQKGNVWSSGTGSALCIWPAVQRGLIQPQSPEGVVHGPVRASAGCSRLYTGDSTCCLEDGMCRVLPAQLR